MANKSAKASSKVKRSLKHEANGKPKKGSGSALSSRNARSGATSRAVAKKASAILRDGRSSSKAKSVAGSALSQVQNPRSGHFVMVDRASGSIISHKKSRGAYKGVAITTSVPKQK